MSSKHFTTEHYMEQYKAYLGDLGNIGTRYATAQGFYVSVVSALLGILALTDSPKDGAKVFGALQTPTLVAVCAFCCVLCFLWSKTILHYRKLFRAKIMVLQEIEKHLPIQAFELEYKALRREEPRYNRKTGVNQPSLLAIEQNVPLFLVLFFVLIAAVRLYKCHPITAVLFIVTGISALVAMTPPLRDKISAMQALEQDRR